MNERSGTGRAVEDVVALVVLVADLLALVWAAAVILSTWHEFGSHPQAEPVPGLGYAVGTVFGTPAVVSLVLLALARRRRGPWGDALLGLALVPPLVIGLTLLLDGHT